MKKYKRKIALTIGLLDSKVCAYEGQRKVLADHGIDVADVIKLNIKGVYQIWSRDAGCTETPLDLFYPYTREGCKLCPDFAPEHADISTVGIGKNDGWTIRIVRTARGEEWMKGGIDAVSSKHARVRMIRSP